MRWNLRWRGYAADGTLNEANARRILDSFLRARRWDESRTILESHRKLLLSARVLDSLRARAAYRRLYPYEGDLSADQLELHLRLLQDAKKRGISAAWEALYAWKERMQTTSDETPQTRESEPADSTQGGGMWIETYSDSGSPLDSVDSYISFDELAHTHNERNAALLDALQKADTEDAFCSLITDDAEGYLDKGFSAYLEREAGEYQDSHDMDTAHRLQSYASFLEDARQQGIPTAWESHKDLIDFSEIKIIVKLILELFLTSGSRDDAYEILERHAQILTTSTALECVKAAQSYYSTIGDLQLAEASEHCLKLLEDLANLGLSTDREEWEERLDLLAAFRPLTPVNTSRTVIEDLRTIESLPSEEKVRQLTAMLGSIRRTDNPHLWAVLHLRRGRYHYHYAEHETTHAEHETTTEVLQERALVDFDIALHVLSRDLWPMSWAVALKERGYIYVERLQGDHESNLAQALSDYRAALSVIFPELFPEMWASIHENIGRALMDTVRETYAEDIEQALFEFDLALRVFKRSLGPDEWSELMMKKGIAYHKRVQGDLAENREQVLGFYEAALTIQTREHNPRLWSQLLHNRAVAYRDRIRGDDATNLEHALADFNAALEVRTRSAMPFFWAETRANRGFTYLHLEMGDRALNCELALADFNAALEVRTRSAMPFAWAETHLYRAHAYTQRRRGDRKDNLRKALDDLAACLEIYTESAAPWRHWQAQLERGHILEGLGDLQQAHEAYVAVRRAYQAMSGASRTEGGRLALLGMASERDIYTRDAFVLLRCDPPDVATAALTLEEGRAQGLRARLQLDLSALAQEDDPRAHALIEELDQAAAEWGAAQQSTLRHLGSALELRSAEEALTLHRQGLQSSYERYQRAEEAVRRSGIADNDSREVMLRYLAQATAAPESAVVYLFAHSRGGHAIVVRYDNELQPKFHDIPLPALTDDALSPLLLTTAVREVHGHDGNRFAALATGGLVAAQMKVARALLPAWGVNLREVATELPSGCGFRIAAQVLLDAWSSDQMVQDMLTRSFSSLSEDEWLGLADVFESTLLNLELRRCLSALGNLGFSKLAEFLHDHHVSTVSLIPCGRLSLFPLPSTLINMRGNARYFCDAFETRLAPSGFAVHASSIRASRIDRESRPLFLTLGNPTPHPTYIRDLPAAEAESKAASDIATAFGYAPDAILRLQPSEGGKGQVIHALEHAWLAHLAVHGRHSVDDPLNSLLVLAGDEEVPEVDRYLYLHEVLHGNVNVRGMRLLVLSGCETAVNDMVRVPDEVLSLASGFLYAGAAGVIASSWAVDDDASFLLITRFFQLYLNPRLDYSPARALAMAQRWLREEANYRTLATYSPTWQVDAHTLSAQAGQADSAAQQSGVADRGPHPILSRLGSLEETTTSDVLNRIRSAAALKALRNPNELPYADPIFWASFMITGC